MKKLGLVFIGLIITGALFWSCSEDNSTTITEVEADNVAPTCAITSPASSRIFEKGSALEVKVDAEDTDGNVFEVRYYIDGVQDGTDKDSPYSYSFETDELEVGSHIIKATAVDSDGAKTSDSVEVVINVYPGCHITYPIDNSYFTSGDDIEIMASASDDEKNAKTVSKVDFYAGDLLISTDTTSPYTAGWTMGDSDCMIIVKTTDDHGSVSSDSIDVWLNKEVIFSDANLEQAVRTEITKPVGTIYSSDLGYITEFEAYLLGIIDLKGMEHFRSLETLNLFQNQISDLTPISDLKNLKILHLDNNMISDLSPLEDLSELETLSLGYNNVVDISALRNLTKLNYIDFSFNQIAEINALSNLTGLTSVNLSQNQIIDITSLKNLTGIKILRLGNNDVSDISSLNLLSDISNLDLNDNQIDDITVMSNISELNSVNLRNNNITDISAFRNLPKIRNIYLENNQVSDIYPLVQNSDFAGLGNLELNINPLDSVSINVYIPEIQSRGIMVSW
ncbi:MAG: Ig-like domain-containing protein [Candidatus Delongbacteria bacterium]|nr:Ig-like domain-containing protein [Candidatus Delongbacteria bacterium]MDD4205610.1 Ig-like domain-containing protein [Candidatus Delongbacteria bacterium]